MRTHDPHAHAGLCAVQEFSWTEDELLQAKAERGESLEPEAAAALAKEPMFCFEVCACICCLLRTPTDCGASQCHSALWYAADMSQDALLVEAHVRL